MISSIAMAALIEVYVPSPNVLFQRFADGAVVYSPGDESYFGLNGTGAEIWNALPKEGASFDDLLQNGRWHVSRGPRSRAPHGSRTISSSELVKHGLLRRDTVEVAA